MSYVVKVSVIVLTFNASDFIRETIYSIVSQNYENLEIIVGDDASSDDTLNILEKIHREIDVPITILAHLKNIGISKNFNECLNACTGDYIFLLGHDDVFLPGKIKKQIDYMESHSDVMISYHEASVFDSGSGEILYLYNKDKHGFYSGNADLLISQGTFCCGCTVAVRNIDLPRCDETIRYASDWLWYIEILLKSNGRIDFFPGVYSSYRRHNNNITKLSNLSVQMDETLYTLKKIKYQYSSLIDICNNSIAERYFAYGIKLLLAKKIKNGVRVLLQKDVLTSGFYLFLRRMLKLPLSKN